MKKLFILFSSILMGIQSFAFIPNEIDQKIQKTFDSSFPDAQEVSWLDYPEAYEVSFVENGIRARILYAKDNSFVRLTRYYKEANLSYHVRLAVQKQYPGKKIFGVTEISTVVEEWKDTSVVYHIILEDDQKWLTVTLERDGSFTPGKKLKKGSK